MKLRWSFRLCAAMALCLLLSGCTSPKTGPRKLSETYFDLFDTVTTVTAVTVPEEEFARQAQAVYDALMKYHRLFDIYQEYEGMNNLKTVNDRAGIEPVAVDDAILQLLQDCKDFYALTDGRVNAAMGSVLTLWHEARSAALEAPETAGLPDRETLRRAAAHTDIHAVELDHEKGTVYISDPEVQLDVGAIAKGWAAQKAAEAAVPGLLISVGGNVCATGPKDAGGTAWVVGIQDPDGGSGYLHTLELTRGSVVTSGDYQRFFTVDGKRYHHIIDPDTLWPCQYWRSVTVVCEDSALADVLSTALFLLPREEGQALLDKTGAEAIWLDHTGTLYFSNATGA